jgi:glycosyltransferase involved in cell wall biosynthesis
MSEFIQNNIVIISAFRNVRSFIKTCAFSITSQKYKNWRAVFCDDCSDDGTSDMIPEDPRFTKRYNKERITALPNIHYSLVESNIQDEDIVCFVDGDDFLFRTDALDIVNSMYQDNTLFAYGQYIHYNGVIGHCQSYDKTTFKDLRKEKLPISHLRSFRYKVYKEFLKQDPDLSSYKDKNGKFYTMSADVSIMTPLFEICGIDNIKFNPIPIYYYRFHSTNECHINPSLQKQYEIEILSKDKFKQIF